MFFYSGYMLKNSGFIISLWIIYDLVEELITMENTDEVDALFRYTAEGILIVDQSGSIVRINPSAERLFGYERDELLNEPIEILIPGHFKSRHEHFRNKYTDSPHARVMGSGIDLYGLKKDGTELPVEISLSPYKTKKGQFVIAFIIDNTIRKQAEEKLRNYSIELEKQVQNRTIGLQNAVKELENTKHELHKALDKERDVNELKSRFVSLASHEFRTPLTTIYTSLHLISAHGNLNEKQTQYALKIKKSINHLTDILNDFLSLSKLEEGGIEQKPMQVNLPFEIEGIVGEMREYGTTPRDLNYAHTGENEVNLDTKLLKNILFNLISNAIKFSSETDSIIITSLVSGEETRISVKDNGIGISEADQQHLFERFFRGENATYIPGTGLGLNLVAKYVELMSGKIVVDSSKDKGTCFTLILPNKSDPT